MRCGYREQERQRAYGNRHGLGEGRRARRSCARRLHRGQRPAQRVQGRRPAPMGLGRSRSTARVRARLVGRRARRSDAQRHAVRAERARALTRARGRRGTRGRARGHGPAHGVDAARGRRPVGRPAPRRVAAVGRRAPASVEHDRHDVRPARPGGRHRVGAKPKRAGAAVERAGRRCARQCRSRNGLAVQHSRRRAATGPADARDDGQPARRTDGSDRRSLARTAEPRTGFADADQQLGATHTRGGAALAAREQPHRRRARSARPA